MSSKEYFVLSYSGGKDAMSACFHAIRSGRQPLGAVTTFNRESHVSWFHELPATILRQAEQSLGLPMRIVETTGDRYADDFENALEEFKIQGAESVVFGDIDIQEHYDWCNARCSRVGLRSVFPLWHMERNKVVEEMIDAGFQAIITVIDRTRVDEKYLGKTLTHAVVSQMIDDGIDSCGENGEYHTFVYDGPLFRNKIEFMTGAPVQSGNRIHLPLSTHTPSRHAT